MSRTLGYEATVLRNALTLAGVKRGVEVLTPALKVVGTAKRAQPAKSRTLLALDNRA